MIIDAVEHLMMPVMTLAAGSWAYLLRVTRSSMLTIVESVFSLPGLGSRFDEAAVNVDVVATLGLAMFLAVTDG